MVASLQTVPQIEVAGVAPNGRLGVKIIKQIAPELVVTQFNMPDMTGPALTRAVKTDGIPPPIVVIISLNDNPEYPQLAERADADGYLSHSNMDQFVPLVKKLIGDS
jgi:DNA-binding NarL/FixJ family response regulator